ncbi:DUF2267 domain-containing protein [bacterium]|nr:MAG: DUF2267 domain-containing protein [bacterium]
MATGHVALFDSAAQDAGAWLNDIMIELEWSDRHLALQALRGTLHAVRDHLPLELSAHLASQLPTLIRGIYFEGWQPGHTPLRDRNRANFLLRAGEDITQDVDDDELAAIVGAVLRVLEQRVSEGEASKVLEALPKSIRELLGD